MLKPRSWLPILLLFALSWSAHAEEQESFVKDAIVVGGSFSGKTDYTITNSNGSLLGSASDRSNGYVLFGGELTYQSHFPLGGSLIIEGTRYQYTTGATSDGELGVYFMPRLAHTFGAIELWAGFGLGVMVSNLGGSSSETINGVTVTLENMTPASFAWTPRAGIDVNVARHLFVGAQFSYTRTTISIPFFAFSGGSSISGTDEGTRSWLGAALRAGLRL